MAGMLSGCGSERHSQVSRAAFRSTVDGKATDLYTLRNARGLEMTVTNFGGRVVELWVPDATAISRTSCWGTTISALTSIKPESGSSAPPSAVTAIVSPQGDLRSTGRSIRCL